MSNVSRLEKRANIIKYIYQNELMENPLDAVDAFESGDFSAQEVKVIENIAKNYLKFKKIIIHFLKNSWDWTRVSPLERAILIYGAYELTFNDKALVINELVIITRGYIPGDSYKWINATLESIGLYYEKQKKTSN